MHQVKCVRPNCPNRAARSGQQQGLCTKHYKVAPTRGYVDGEPVRERIELLIARGMSLRSIEDLTGVSCWWVRNSKGRVQKRTRDRVMAIAVPSGIPDTHGYIPSLGSVRRIQALAAIGWAQCMLGPMLDRDITFAHSITSRTVVRASTASMVDDLYRKLHMTPGPSDTARRVAKQRGWAPPLAWDDIDTDEHPVTGPPTVTPFPDRYQELRDMGLRLGAIAERMGVQRDSLERQLHRHGMYEGRSA